MIKLRHTIPVYKHLLYKYTSRFRSSNTRLIFKLLFIPTCYIKNKNKKKYEIDVQKSQDCERSWLVCKLSD